ncbi:MAG: DUF4129 domain-containing protein [Bacteroidota bacterium]
MTKNSSLWAQEESIVEGLEEIESGPHPQEVYQGSEQKTHSFDYEQWFETVDGIDYSQGFRKNDDYDEDFSDTPGEKKKKEQDAENLGGNSPIWNLIVKILFGTIAFGLLFLIIYSIAKGNLFRPQSKKFKPNTEFSIETIEENIHESDLDRYLRQALSDENYALAIRLYYLAMIKALSLNRIIKWKRDKTNRDYLRELKAYPLAKDFREATRIFERIWYGKAAIKQTDFQTLQPRFQQWVKQAQQLQKMGD